MSFFQLAPEILTSIFKEVGSVYFQADIRRLMVSKQWALYAKDAVYRSLTLTPEILERFIALPSGHSAKEALPRYLRSLDIKLHGFQDWNQDALATVTSQPHMDVNTQSKLKWSKSLNYNLVWLGNFLRNIGHLSDLRILAVHETCPCVPNYRNIYLCEAPILGLLQINHLALLDIDLNGGHFNGHLTDDHTWHLCSVVAGLLHHLRRLKIRANKVCPQLLMVTNDEMCTNLEEIIINLSLEYRHEDILLSRSFAKRCGSLRDSPLELKADMEEQAINLKRHLYAPKTIRIVYHIPPELELKAFDAIEQKQVKLQNDIAWDCDQQSISEYSESVISNSTSSVSSA